MIKSIYILDVLNKMVEGCEQYSDQLKGQIPFLTDHEYDYTGMGVFVNFIVEEAGLKFKMKEDEFIFDGLLVIQSTELRDKDGELKYGGCATLFIKGGLIDCLEIMGNGDSYPKRDLKDYKLIQTWINTDFAPNIIDNT